MMITTDHGFTDLRILLVCACVYGRGEGHNAAHKLFRKTFLINL